MAEVEVRIGGHRFTRHSLGVCLPFWHNYSELPFHSRGGPGLGDKLDGPLNVEDKILYTQKSKV